MEKDGWPISIQSHVLPFCMSLTEYIVWSMLRPTPYFGNEISQANAEGVCMSHATALKLGPPWPLNADPGKAVKVHLWDEATKTAHLLL